MHIRDVSLLQFGRNRYPCLGFIFKWRHVEKPSEWGDTYAHFLSANCCRDCIDGFEEKPDSILDRASILISTVVHSWIDELLE
ncbi:hypothetical protein D3C71_1770110 [compost metagenome]